MVLLEVIESPNIDRIGEYEFYRDDISFGTSQWDQVLIIEVGILHSHCILKMESNKLILVINENVEFIHVNGKRTTSSKILKINDKFRIGNTTIKVLNFSSKNIQTRKEFLNAKVQRVQDENPDLIPILQYLNK